MINSSDWEKKSQHLKHSVISLDISIHCIFSSLNGTSEWYDNWKMVSLGLVIYCVKELDRRKYAKIHSARKETQP